MAQLRILVTGAAGYIGSVLCRQLLAQGHFVKGYDRLLFGGDSLLELLHHPNFEFIKADIREVDLLTESLRGMDNVVHLAAIVGDPACKKFAEDASETMDKGSRVLYETAQAVGVSRFVFASTCSNYGQMEGDILLDEFAELQPQSHYARLKVGFEQYLMSQPASGLKSCILRFATVYGHSPRIRFDLTINHFTRDLSLGHELLVFGQHQWRPYCHVNDLANAISLSLGLSDEKFTHGVFNIGDSEENYSKAMILKEILKQIPEAKIKYGSTPDGDTRNYRVDFSAAASELGFKISKRVPDGIREIRKLMASGMLADPFSEKFKND